MLARGQTKTVLYIRYKICSLIKANLKIQMECNGIFSKHRLKTLQCHLFKQQPIGKRGDKYRLLLFMHGNEIGLLTPFSKFNKLEDLNKVQVAGKKF